VFMIASITCSHCIWRDARVLRELLNRGAADDTLVRPHLMQVNVRIL
jgi:hypothetical protein